MIDGRAVTLASGYEGALLLGCGWTLRDLMEGEWDSPTATHYMGSHG